MNNFQIFSPPHATSASSSTIGRQNIIITRQSLSQLLKLCGWRELDPLVAIAAPDLHAAPSTLQQQVCARTCIGALLMRVLTLMQWVDVESEGEEQLMHALLRILQGFSPVTAPSASSSSLPSSLPSLPVTLIFTPTRSSCERTASFLSSAGFAAAALHGGFSLQHTLHQQQLLQQRAISCIGNHRPASATTRT